MGIIVIPILQMSKQSLRMFNLLATGYPGKNVTELEVESRQTNSKALYLKAHPLARALGCHQSPGSDCYSGLLGRSREKTVKRVLRIWTRGIGEFRKKDWSLKEK